MKKTESKHNPTLAILPAFQRLSDNTRDNTIVMTSGKGIFVYDDKGNEYLEATSSFYGAILGYGDEELIAAIEDNYINYRFTLPVFIGAMTRR